MTSLSDNNRLRQTLRHAATRPLTYVARRGLNMAYARLQNYVIHVNTYVICPYMFIIYVPTISRLSCNEVLRVAPCKKQSFSTGFHQLWTDYSLDRIKRILSAMLSTAHSGWSCMWWDLDDIWHIYQTWTSFDATAELPLFPSEWVWLNINTPQSPGDKNANISWGMSIRIRMGFWSSLYIFILFYNVLP